MKNNIKRKLITIKCDFCGCVFSKPESEYTRNARLGRHNFCSRSCAGKHMHSLGLPATEKQRQAAKENILKANRNDIYTPFRSTLRRVRNRFRKVDITLDDLKELWEKQKGKCAYTNIDLQLPIGSRVVDIRYQASLDRIDSSKGYIKGNVQFVAAPINYMKTNMPDKEFKEYLSFVAKSVVDLNSSNNR